MKRIVPHNPLWALLYAEEAASLKDTLRNAANEVHHMGSTAIPGLKAKPVLDILIEVSSLSAIDTYSKDLANKGYEARGEYGISGRRYFKKKPIADAVGFHLHAYLVGSYQIRRHLAFRDYLILNPEIVGQYNTLKTKLSYEDGRLKPEYQALKKPFVDGIALEALNYYRTKC